MGKRPRRQPTSAHTQPSGSGSQADSPWIDYLSRSWVPVAFFALLTVIYFYQFIFSGDVIYGSDTGSELNKGMEPIAEKIANIEPANWSRYMGGTPESSGLRAQYFPLQVIALFTSEHRYFGWRYVISMFCAGYFTFLCVRGLGLHPLAALIAGVAYASAPAFLTFPRAGHFAKMSVISLLPLMYWALDRGIDTQRMIYFLILAGAIGVGIYTPHLQMVYFALWAIGALFLYKVTMHYLSDKNLNLLLMRSVLSVGAICLGLAIGAEGVFPQYWNTKTATKRGGEEQGGAGYDYAASWSLHPEEIFALVIPEFGGFDLDEKYRYWGRNAFKGNSEYVGIVPLFFALLTLGHIRKNSHVAFLFALFVLSVLYSLGPHTPLHKLFYHLVPGVKVLRVPGMIAFVFSFALCILSAYGLHRLLTGNMEAETLRKLKVVGGLSAAILMLFAVAPSVLLSIWRSVFWTDMPAVRVQTAQASLSLLGQGALLAALFVGILTVSTTMLLQGKLRPLSFVVILVSMIVLDTWRIDKLFLTYVNPNRVPPKEKVNPNAVAFLKQDNSLFRVLSIPPERESPLPGIDMVYGFNDFAIKRYNQIINSEDLGRVPILNLLNAKYVVSENPINAPWLQEVAVRDNLHIFQNAFALPWFYLSPNFDVITNEDRILEKLRDVELNPAQTALLEENPGIAPDAQASNTGSVEQLAYDARQGYIELKTQAPGTRILVVSQNYHPNWHVFVNGQEKLLLRANYLWQGVALESGEHKVELRYRDPIVAITRWITLSGTVVLIVGLVVLGRQRKEESIDAG